MATSKISQPHQVTQKIKNLRVKAFQANDESNKYAKLFLFTLIPMVGINIALTIGPAFIGKNAKLLAIFAQVLGAINTAIVTFTSQLQFQAKRDKQKDKAVIYSSLATEMQNHLLFPGFDKVYTETDWSREVQKMGAYCTSVEKAVAAKIPDIVVEAPAHVPLVPRHTNKETSKPRVDSEHPKSQLSVSKSLVSLKQHLNFKKSKPSLKSVKIVEEKTDTEKPSPQVFENDRGHFSEVGSDEKPAEDLTAVEKVGSDEKPAGDFTAVEKEWVDSSTDDETNFEKEIKKTRSEQK